MNDETWGGRWTDEKLGVLRGYLEAYLAALKNMPFELGYVDAFAGAGYRVDGRGGDPAQRSLLGDAPAQAYREGAARIALGLDPGFDAYVFIERREAKAAELAVYAAEHARSRSVQVLRGDANERLRDLCGMNWRGRRAVVFLDPYGMQVEWPTLEALASTEAVDVWVLFPLGVAVNRLLAGRLDQITPAWRRRLDATFGTPEWAGRLYETAEEKARRTGASLTLFDEPVEGGPTKAVGLDEIAAYYVERLGTVFPHVAQRHRVLRDPDGRALYALVFAAANPSPKAGALSLRIAGHLLDRGPGPARTRER